MAQTQLRNFLSALLLIATAPVAQAQLAPYAFSQSTGTYTPLSGAPALDSATATSGAASLDDVVRTVNIFPFVFNNAMYTTVHINSNGYLAFGGAPSGSTSNPLNVASPPFAGAVAGQVMNLKGAMVVNCSGNSGSTTLTGVSNAAMLKTGQVVSATFIPAGTTITAISGTSVTLSQAPTGSVAQLTVATARLDTATLGTAPNRTFVVQWSGFNTGASILNAYVNFQIRLAEGGGVASGRTVSVMYGPEAGPGTSVGMQVGLRGGNTGSFFNNRADSSVANTDWMLTASGSSASASTTFSSTLKPASGLVFTWTPAGPCAVSPTGLAATNLTASGADVSWAAVPDVSTYSLEYGMGAFTPGTGTVVSGLTGTTHTLAGLQAGTNYRMYIRSLCSAIDSSAQSVPVSFLTRTTNDTATSAVALVVGGGCNTAQFSNIGAGHIDSLAGQPYEPTGTANTTQGFATVYFKFRAPAGGAVRLSTDYAGGTLIDTRLALFSATDSTNYATFSEIACDEDNGVIAPTNSILYATGLTPGQTYYVQVGSSSGAVSAGSFCITVDSLSGAMLSTNGAACAAGPQPFGGNTTYRGWTSLVDASGKLVAMVRQPLTGNTSPGGLLTSLTVHTGAVRREYGSTGRFYLNRNYLIGWSALNADVRLFFTKAELDSLGAADGVSTTPGSLLLMRQTGGSCQSAFDSSAGVESMIPLSGSGLTGGVGWVDFTTPGFSNFYLMGGAVALASEGIDIQAYTLGAANHIFWTATGEKPGTRYELQRSANGRDFATIATKMSGEASYSHEDSAPLGGLNSYRIQAAGADGQVVVSRVVMVENNTADGTAIQVFPNPASDALRVRIASIRAGTVTLTDATGRTFYTTQPARGEFSVDLRALPAGMYLLRYVDNGRAEVVKVIKN